MDDGTCKSESQEALQWSLRIQKGRVRRLVLLENALQKLLPNGWREVLVLAHIAEKNRKAEIDAQRVSSQVPGATVAAEEPHSSTGTLKKIKNLNPGDRQLLREASERLLKFLKKELDDGKTTDPDGKEGNDKEEHRKDE
jgi:hypothetical protein